MESSATDKTHTKGDYLNELPKKMLLKRERHSFKIV